MIAQLTSRIPGLVAVLFATGVLAGCGGNVQKSGTGVYQRAPTTPSEVRTSVGENAVVVAMRQVGVPYRYGGKEPTGFDCSGLVHYSYLHAGKVVPRTTGQLWDSTTTINRSQLQAGDLLFFSIEGKMQHVGMYIGKDQFVHAPSSGKKVQVGSLKSQFYGQAFLRAGRPK